jgi:hypothetical protein
MLRFSLKLALLISSLILFDFLIGLLLDVCMNNTPDGIYYKAVYSLEKCKEDIIIFGACEGEADIIPKVLEDSLKKTCWNSARNGHGFPYSVCIGYGILNRYTPKLAIVSINDDFLSRKLNYNVSAFLRPFYRGHKEIRPILDKISSDEKFFNFSKLYVYNSEYISIFKPFLKKGKNDMIENKGWIPSSFGTITNQTQPKIVNRFDKLNDETVTLFNEFVTNFTKNGCKVFVAIAPIYGETVHNSSTIEYLKKMESIYLIDCDDNKLFTEDEDLYNSSVVLNREGATKYSSILANKIKTALKE